MIKVVNNIQVKLYICNKCKFKFLREKDMVKCDHKNKFEPLPPEPRIKLTREELLKRKREYYQKNKEELKKIELERYYKKKGAT